MKGANKKISNLKINKKIIIIVASIFLLASFITIATIVDDITIKSVIIDGYALTNISYINHKITINKVPILIFLTSFCHNAIT